MYLLVWSGSRDFYFYILIIFVQAIGRTRDYSKNPGSRDPVRSGGCAYCRRAGLPN